MRGGGAMDAGGGVGESGGDGGQRWHEHACLKTSGKVTVQKLMPEKKKTQMRRRVLLKYTPVPTNIQINPHNAFQGFQDLSKTFKVRLLFSSTPDTQTSKLPIDFQGT